MNAEVHLLNMLSAEIWRRLLECVEDPRTRHQILLAFPELRGYFGRCFVAKCLFAEVLPLVSNQLSVSNVLNLRQVCKLWHRDIHTLILNHPYHLPYNEDPENGFTLNTVKINRTCPLFLLATSNPVLHFRNTRQIDQFMQMTVKQTGIKERNIFGGTVWLDPSPQSNNSQELYEQSSFKMLTMFSSEIKKITFSSDREFETALQFYKRLRHYLQLIPSLKSLCVNMEKQVDPRSLSLVIVRLPLPEMPKLECFFYKIIDFNSRVVNYPRSICEALVDLYVNQSSSGVRKFGCGIPVYMLPNKSVNLSKITEFELEPQLRCISFDFTPFKIMPSHCVQKLSIVSNESICLISLLKFVGLLNVKVLDLSYASLIRMLQNNNQNVECPVLHTLYIKDWVAIRYYFLTGLKNLKKLEVWEPKNSGVNTVGTVLKREETMGGFYRKICKTSRKILRLFYDKENAHAHLAEIWEELPSLEEIAVYTSDANNGWNRGKYHKPYCCITNNQIM